MVNVTDSGGRSIRGHRRPGNSNPVIESGADSKNGTGASRDGWM